ncbi:unnamed protein product [Polarella glacialis]|uniref:Calcineurin-like phosphoesterase domain-containing protein n=1 Tax=Polarella glacialis TaxID=89957 RepID=A0A813JHF9_POLGL|nr:unnamed protein product [Polarella glacialis]
MEPNSQTSFALLAAAGVGDHASTASAERGVRRLGGGCWSGAIRRPLRNTQKLFLFVSVLCLSCTLAVLTSRRKLSWPSWPLGRRFASQQAQTGSPSGYFLQLSDIHLDPFYNASFGRSCFCNRPSTSDASNSCRTSAESSPRPFGQHGCDAPAALLNATLLAAAAHAPPGGYDWVLLTGDYTRHFVEQAVKGDTKPQVLGIIRQVQEAMDEYLPGTVVHQVGGAGNPFVLGNNDFSTDYGMEFTDPSKGPNPWFSSLATILFARFPVAPSWMHGPFLGSEEKTFTAGGFFASKLSSSLTLVALNTVVYSRHMKWPGTSGLPEDPFGQLQWLRSQLSGLRELRRGQAREGDGSPGALIIGHIPPGFDHLHFTPLWMDGYTKAYMSVISEFAEVVAGQIFAHQHADTLRLFPASMGAAVPPIFVAGAVSAIYANNPSFRIWRYEGSKLLDFTSVSASLEAFPEDASARSVAAASALFQKRYSAREAFGLTSMASEEWREQVVQHLLSSMHVWRQYLGSLWNTDSGPEYAHAVESASFRVKAACAAMHILEHEFAACIAAQRPES